MAELIKNEIGDNQISKKIGEINWLENKIKDSYKEIYETKGELQDLKKEVMNNLSGETLKAMLEKDLTVEHVKMVLQSAVGKFEAAKNSANPNDHIAFMDVYSAMGAGLVFNMQLALAKLGCKFEQGIDGIYGSKDTNKRIQEFQNAWNTAHADDQVAVDGRAGQETLTRIISALDDASWDKNAIVPVSTKTSSEETDTDTDTDVETTDVKMLSAEEALADKESMQKNHLRLVPQDGYEFVDASNPDNVAVTKIGEDAPEGTALTYEKALADFDSDVNHLKVQPEDGYDWIDEKATDNYATKLMETDTKQEQKKEVKKTTAAKTEKPATPKKETTKKTKEVTPPIPVVSKDELMKDPAKHHVKIINNVPTVDPDYEWADDGTNPDNFATKPKASKKKEVTTSKPTETAPTPAPTPETKADVPVTGLDKKYDKIADLFESYINDPKYNAVDKCILIEKEVLKTLINVEQSDLPKQNSRFALLREKAFENARAEIKTMSFAEPAATPEGAKKFQENYEKLAKYKKALLYTTIDTDTVRHNGVDGKLVSVMLDIDVQLSKYMGYHINKAFAGTKIDTKTFKMYIIDGNQPSKVSFISYGYRKALDMKEKKVGGLNIIFADQGETIRVANLINKIRSLYKPEDKTESRFELSSTGEIEQRGAGRFGMTKDLVTDYTIFPTLQGKANNKNKQALVDYLNAKVADVAEKFMPQRTFEAYLSPEVKMSTNSVWGAGRLNEYMNKITVDKVKRVTAQLKKEGYPMKDNSILLDQTNSIIKDNNGNSSYVIDVRQDSDDMLSYLRKAMAPAKAAYEADLKKPMRFEDFNAKAPKEITGEGTVTDLQKEFPNYLTQGMLNNLHSIVNQLKQEGYIFDKPFVLNGASGLSSGGKIHYLDIRLNKDAMMKYLRSVLTNKDQKKNGVIKPTEQFIKEKANNTTVVKQDTAKGKPAPANPEAAKKAVENNADQQLIDANFTGRTFKLKNIFTAEDMNNPQKKAKIDKLRNAFSNSNFSKDGGGMDIEDAAIVRRVDPTTKVETKYIQLTLDNDGMNQDMYKNIQIPYDKVVKDGKLDGKAFRETLRSYFVINVFPKI